MKTLDSISDFIIWNILASIYYKLLKFRVKLIAMEKVPEGK